MQNQNIGTPEFTHDVTGADTPDTQESSGGHRKASGRLKNAQIRKPRFFPG